MCTKSNYQSFNRTEPSGFSEKIFTRFTGIKLMLMVWIFLIHAVQLQADSQAVSPYRLSFQIDTSIVKIPYYRNFTLGANASVVKHAVIVIHGVNRNSDDYYDSMLDAAFGSGSLNTANFIMAPNFLTESDMVQYDLDPDVLFWQSSGWPEGDLSVSTVSYPTPARMSSFAVMDSIIWRLANLYAELDTIIIVGHSAGGQYVQRYAAANPMDSLITSTYGIYIRYIVANPSSYVYMSDERHVPGTIDQFATPTPEQIGFCTSYNDYKYGLENPNNYIAAAGAAKIRQQYRNRAVIYLLGENDNDPNNSTLDKTCAAMIQGNHRLERGTIYYNYVRHYYDSTIVNFHKKAIVPGVSHDYDGMFNSDCGKYFIFNYGSCNSVTALNESTPAVNPESTLHQNFPNPFNPGTTISFSLKKSSPVSLKIYDLSGKLVKVLQNEQIYPTGVHDFYWDGTNKKGEKVGSGIYFLVLYTDKFRDLKRMVLLK